MRSSSAHLNPVQQEVIEAGFLDAGFHTLLSMTTGSGKTFLGEIAIDKALSRGRRAIYLTPIRALGSELADKWQERFAPHAVGIFTGDYGVSGKPYPVPFCDARVLIMTPERLDACTRMWRTHLSWLAEVDLVIADELHLLGDPNRGARLEGTLLRLMRLNPFSQILGLSATLGNLAELTGWLQGVCYHSSWRQMPLDWRITTFKKAKEKPDVLAEELSLTVGKTLVFVQSRRRAEDLAAQMRERGFKAAHHHAGLSMTQRAKVEAGFRGDEIDAILATPTLEVGVNLACRKVILYDIQAFDGRSYEPLSTISVWQRVGRAGRRGLDTKGEAVLIAPRWDQKSARRYLEGTFEPIKSGLFSIPKVAEQVVTEVASGLCRTRTQLERVFSRSLAAYQRRLPTLSKIIDQMLEAGMLCEEQEEDKASSLRATRLGRVACRHLLTPATVLLFERARKACPEFTFFDLLLVACSAVDCEPVLRVDFEDLEAMQAQIEAERTYLLQRPIADLEELLDIRGKRLLSALRMALVLRHWTRCADEQQVCDQNNIYSFEVLRLKESAERLLLGLAAVFKIQEEEDEVQVFDPEKVSLYETLSALQRMTMAGLDDENATLALVPGIGPKFARKLIGVGITDIEELAGADEEDLSQIPGISAKRAAQWIARAEELVKTRGAFCFREDEAPHAGFDRSDWPEDVDPYRLQRALELSVSQLDEKVWEITGGSDPRRVEEKGEEMRCDCPDFEKGSICKHILATRLQKGDFRLQRAKENLRGNENLNTFNLFTIWSRNAPKGVDLL